jgi:hypothetical protein
MEIHYNTLRASAIIHPTFPNPMTGFQPPFLASHEYLFRVLVPNFSIAAATDDSVKRWCRGLAGPFGMDPSWLPNDARSFCIIASAIHYRIFVRIPYLRHHR